MQRFLPVLALIGNLAGPLQPAAGVLCYALSSSETLGIEHARTLVDSGQIVEALGEIEALQKLRPNDPDVEFTIGELFQQLAASREERLERAAPDSPEVHELLGKSFESHQKLPEALAQYELAAKRAPSQPGLHFLIGNVFWKQRDFPSAQRALDAELQLNPNHTLANLRMGQVLLATNPDAPRQAIQYLEKAVTDPQADLEAHRELGRALRMAGRYREALRELTVVAQRKPDDDLVHAQLAAVYRAQGDTTAAQRELQVHKKILDSKREASIQVHQNQQPQ